jgi:plastocyanin
VTLAPRRPLLGAALGVLGGTLPILPRASGAAEPVEIRMVSDAEGSIVHFDPIGIRVAPETRIRWRCVANVHTTTAYHPKNREHSLRIPKAANPWDSDYLLPGQTFEIVLNVEGVYDYFCVPHEMAGMVGRIIVGTPGGPGALPFDYFRGRPGTESWLQVPGPAQTAFPSIAEIMARRIVRSPARAS